MTIEATIQPVFACFPCVAPDTAVSHWYAKYRNCQGKCQLCNRYAKIGENKRSREQYHVLDHV